ncbi:hypothetical protein [Mameliella sediminis]|uniref:hypothetical protein n=1 Tax=Mameliella sediminis TaxID=2836866 RepID=UPI001C451932|nr:hypothetical protein [Mameliella sediminis]MBY6115707.1 hypothetical protein [Antarctobacter heliothermus]MBY6145954.1 hypothetical protein [Mameliella alba]MBV7393325.1 hypothetical protein [Mameliella sediminis]MBY6161276.1 hypothetical protein [Mameliella alba]MBY6169746.1 hypothetical protein [Mameliella alba]
MKTTLTTIAALTAFSLPAFAQDMEGAKLDMDGDGLVSLEEVQAMYPDVSQDDFTGADADGDGLLSAEELEAARTAGVIPADES